MNRVRTRFILTCFALGSGLWIWAHWRIGPETFEVSKVAYGMAHLPSGALPITNVLISITNQTGSPIRVVGYVMGPEPGIVKNASPVVVTVSWLGANEQRISEGVSTMRLIFAHAPSACAIRLVRVPGEFGRQDQAQRALGSGSATTISSQRRVDPAVRNYSAG